MFGMGQYCRRFAFAVSWWCCSRTRRAGRRPRGGPLARPGRLLLGVRHGLGVPVVLAAAADLVGQPAGRDAVVPEAAARRLAVAGRGADAVPLRLPFVLLLSGNLKAQSPGALPSPGWCSDAGRRSGLLIVPGAREPAGRRAGRALGRSCCARGRGRDRGRAGACSCGSWAAAAAAAARPGRAGRRRAWRTRPPRAGEPRRPHEPTDVRPARRRWIIAGPRPDRHRGRRLLAAGALPRCPRAARRLDAAAGARSASASRPAGGESLRARFVASPPVRAVGRPRGRPARVHGRGRAPAAGVVTLGGPVEASSTFRWAGEELALKDRQKYLPTRRKPKEKKP